MALRVFAVLMVTFLWPAIAMSQGLQVAFDGFDQDSDQPIEISSDSLSINQDDGSAVLTGNVVVGQGSMRLAAPKITVSYTDGGGISTLLAEGGV
ncbi:MAG: LptA/OstA family protein, partial [Pseudomonadota bacterium]